MAENKTQQKIIYKNTISRNGDFTYFRLQTVRFFPDQRDMEMWLTMCPLPAQGGGPCVPTSSLF